MPRSFLILIGLLMVGFPNARAQMAWVDVAPMPTPRAYAAVAVLNGQVYVMGGRGAGGNALGTVQRYNPASNTWSAVEGLREPRYNAAAAVLGGRILLTGGRESDGRVTDDVEVYVPSENDWESFDSLENEREGHAAFTVGDDAYVFGGSGPGGGFLAGAEYYDGDEEHWYVYDEWTLDAPRAAFAAVPQSGGVLIFGGYSQFGPLADVEFYVPGQGGAAKAPLPEPRGGLAGAGTDREAWAIGGRNAAGTVTDRVDVYDRTANQWTASTALPAPREGAVAAVVNGVVYVFGGQDGQGSLHTSSLSLVVPNAAEEDAADAGFALERAGPNPFRDGTRLALRLAHPADADVAVYDLLGRRVAVLYDGMLPAGRHLLGWDGTDAAGRALPAGQYIVRASAGEQQATLRLTRVR